MEDQPCGSPEEAGSSSLEEYRAPHQFPLGDAVKDREGGGSSLSVAGFGCLADGTIVMESDIAALFNKHRQSVKRAVERGELPPPVRLMGQPVWTVGAIRRHIEVRLDTAAREREKIAAKTAPFRRR